MRNAAIILTLLTLFTTAVLADVPPDPGFERRSANLVLETETDLSGYRFLLASFVEAEEVKIAAGTPTLISASERAGASRFARLYAIPAREYQQFAERLTDEELRKALQEKKLFNAIELLSHNFQTTVPEGSSFQDPVYRIERYGETGIKAVRLSGGPTGARVEFGIYQLSRTWNTAGIAVVAGILLMCAITILGIWYFRRSPKIS
jgi:hypothetical protein